MLMAKGDNFKQSVKIFWQLIVMRLLISYGWRLCDLKKSYILLQCTKIFISKATRRCLNLKSQCLFHTCRSTPLLLVADTIWLTFGSDPPLYCGCMCCCKCKCWFCLWNEPWNTWKWQSIPRFTTNIYIEISLARQSRETIYQLRPYCTAIYAAIR